MKISGYEVGDLFRPFEEIKFFELGEITLEATPKELRKIADFLTTAAHHMETMGSDYDHEHLGDGQPEFNDPPYLTVFGSNNASS